MELRGLLKRGLWCLITGSVLAVVAPAQSSSGSSRNHDLSLARALADADEGTRDAAIRSVVASRQPTVRSLLTLAHEPPAQFGLWEQARLATSLADIFGELRAPEAIPFLVEKISIENLPWPSPDIWTKPHDVIIARMPAVRALIRIGAPAAAAIMKGPEPCEFTSRMAGTLVVSRIAQTMRNPQEAVLFLKDRRAGASMELQLAEEGLKSLNAK
jgi:hypothetical protein